MGSDMRLVLPGTYGPGARLAIGSEDAAHLHVLRVRVGDAIQVTDGAGKAFQAQLESLQKKKGELYIVKAIEVSAEWPLALTLYQALVKGPKMDWILQKATELGARKIVPVLSERCVVKPGSEPTPRWLEIVRQALRQSGRTMLPEISAARPLAETLQDSLDKKIVCHGSGTVWSTIFPWPPLHSGAGLRVGVWIGPEGGFTEDELERFAAAGADRLRLGPAILRTETAGMAALSLVANVLAPGKEGLSAEE
jgi:16S rRNA (uracil1498-N3)-methyltransferase